MDEEKRYEGTPEKKKKRKKRDGLSRRPVREKKRETVQIGYSSYKRKKRTERERRNVCWPHGRVENPVARNIIEIREKMKKLRYTMQVLHSIPLGGAVRQVGAL